MNLDYTTTEREMAYAHKKPLEAVMLLGFLKKAEDAGLGFGGIVDTEKRRQEGVEGGCWKDETWTYSRPAQAPGRRDSVRSWQKSPAVPTWPAGYCPAWSLLVCL